MAKDIIVILFFCLGVATRIYADDSDYSSTALEEHEWTNNFYGPTFIFGSHARLGQQKYYKISTGLEKRHCHDHKFFPHHVKLKPCVCFNVFDRVVQPTPKATTTSRQNNARQSTGMNPSSNDYTSSLRTKAFDSRSTILNERRHDLHKLDISEEDSSHLKSGENESFKSESEESSESQEHFPKKSHYNGRKFLSEDISSKPDIIVAPTYYVDNSKEVKTHHCFPRFRKGFRDPRTGVCVCPPNPPLPEPSKTTSDPPTSLFTSTDSLTSTSTNADISTSPSTSADISTSPATNADMSTSPSTNADISTSPATSADISTSPSTSAGISTSPSTSADISTSPSTSADISTSHSTNAEISTSPSTSADISTSPSTSADISTSPSTNANISTSPSANADISTSPSTNADISTSPSANADISTVSTSITPTTNAPFTTDNSITNPPSTSSILPATSTDASTSTSTVATPTATPSTGTSLPTTSTETSTSTQPAASTSTPTTVSAVPRTWIWYTDVNGN